MAGCNPLKSVSSRRSFWGTKGAQPAEILTLNGHRVPIHF